MTERKATDILLDLEGKIDKILAYVATIDLNYKLLLNRIGSFPQDPLPTNTTNKAVLLQEENKINKQVQEQEVIFTDVDQDSVDDKSNKKRTSRATTDGKLVPVQQRIIYPDGSNVCVAKVEIKDTDNKIVKQMRTNNVGKWILSLQPGTYNVSIAKMRSTNKPEVDINYNITVPDSDAVVELPAKKV